MRFAPALAAPALALVLAVAGCGKSDQGCGTARGKFPDGLTVLKWDHDTPSFSVREKHYQITVGSSTFKLDDAPLWEAVRFDLEHPAKVYGFSVTWNHLDAVAAKGGTELEAGLYPDFGYNGFDFWQQKSLWSGTRCVSDLQNGQVDYVLDRPLVVDQPGLVYVAHPAFLPGDPTFAVDSHVHAGNCVTFAECHASLDLPQALTSQFFNGVSFPYQFDYVVRLYVEYAPAVPASQKVFEPVAGPVPGLRMAWGDYDNDGFDDLLTITQTTFPVVPTAVLWHNDGGGTFSDASASSGLASVFGSGVWGDYDNDGCLDAYFTPESLLVGATLMHNNCDGTFTDVTASAGPITGGLTTANDPCPNAVTDGYFPQSEGAAWVDLDGDGFLDLYVANYNCGFNLPDFVDNVYRNQGNGTFTDWTATHGFDEHATASRGANPIDLDGDGDMDVLVHDYVLERNLFFRNRGDGTVHESAKGNGLAGNETIFDGTPYWGHTLGTAWGDLDGDGDWDLVEANLAHPRFYGFSSKTRVLLNEGGRFTDISGDWSFPASAAGLRYQETHTVPVLADFDEDGKLDLAISARYDGRPTDFYWGNGDGTFRLDAEHSGLDAKNGWGMAAADFDHDGDVDLATTGGLWRNTLTVGTNHWLQVHAVGNVASNRAAIGATVKVNAGGRSWLRYVEGSTGQGCQDSMNLHFGLGNVSTVDSIEVHFPGGATKAYPGPFAAGQRLWLYENGTVLPGWSNPS